MIKSRHPSTKPVTQGEWVINPGTREISGYGSTATLDQKAMDVLCLLIAHAGEPLSRNQIMEQVWPNQSLSDDVLNVAISTIRKALNDDPRQPKYIRTVPRIGYIWMLPQKTRVQPWKKPYFRWAGLAAVLLATAGIIGQYFFKTDDASQPTSIAVLPFEMIGIDGEGKMVAEGLTEALINRLAEIPDTKVISRTSVMMFVNSKQSLPEIARDLGVNWILEGSVQIEHDEVMVSARLVDGVHDQNIWSRTFQRENRNILTLQDEIARAISEQFNTTLPNRNLHSVDPAAYSAFLKGRYLRHHQEYDDALVSLQEAIELDPDYGLSYGVMAEVYFQKTFRIRTGLLEHLEAGSEAARMAQEVNCVETECYLALALSEMLHHHDFDTAGTWFDTALALNPQDMVLLDWYVRYLTLVGDLDKARETIQVMTDHNPLAYDKMSLFRNLFYEKRYEHALTELKNKAELIGNHPGVWATFVDLYTMLDAPEDIFESGRKLLQSVDAAEDVLAAYDQSYNTEDILEVHTFLYDYFEPHAYTMDKARYLSLMGDYEAVIDMLESGYKNHETRVLWITADPFFDELRDMPRFKRLTRQLNLPEHRSEPTPQLGGGLQPAN